MRRLELVSDCGSCAGLCCELIAFEASADFAFDKLAGERCRHLTAAHSCGIHAQRQARGLGGCALFECFGAGPRATLLLRGEPVGVRVEVFRVLRALGELAWLLRGAQELCPASVVELRSALACEIALVQAAAEGSARELLACEVCAMEARGRALLLRVGVALGGRSGS